MSARESERQYATASTTDRQPRCAAALPALVARILALGLSLGAAPVTAQAPAPAAGRLPIKEALQQEFVREQGRSVDKVQWVQIEQGQTALTALRRNLGILGARVNKDLSEAAYQQALALFDPVVTQTFNHARNDVYTRTANDVEFKKAIDCVAGVCTQVLANNKGVYSITYDQGRPAGFSPTTVDASTATVTGPSVNKSYTATVSKILPKGGSAFASESLIYTNSMWATDVGAKIVGSYNRPFTNQLDFGISSALPGSRFFGDYAAADVGVRVADINQQAAFWQIAGVINSTLLQVEQGFWNLVLSEKIHAATSETRERILALAARTDRLVQMQEATRYDKAKIDAQLATLRRQEREALNGYVTASNALVTLLDLDKDTILLPVGYEPRIKDSVAIELRDALQQAAVRNPQILLAETNKKASAELLEQGRVQLRPDLSGAITFSKGQSNAVFGYSTGLKALSRATSPDSNTQTYSLTYIHPWDNRAAKSNFLQAESRFQQQETLVEQTRRSIASRVTLAVSNLYSAQQRTKLALQSRDLAESVFGRAIRQRSLGVVSDFEVIVKSIDRLNADLDYQSALLSQKIAEAAVYASIGSLPQRYGQEGAK